jgi:hypothetical protein
MPVLRTICVEVLMVSVFYFKLQYYVSDTILYYITIQYFIFLWFFLFFVPYTNTDVGGTGIMLDARIWGGGGDV